MADLEPQPHWVWNGREWEDHNAIPGPANNENGRQPFNNRPQDFIYIPRNDGDPMPGSVQPPATPQPPYNGGPGYCGTWPSQQYAYPQQQAYPYYPYGYPMHYPTHQPNYAVYGVPYGPHAAPQPQPPTAATNKYWYGRSPAEVVNERVHAWTQQVHPGVAPANPRPDDDFWVLEKNGRDRILKNYATIMNDHQPGHWEMYAGGHFLWKKD